MTKLQMLLEMAILVQYMHLGYEKTSTNPVECISEKNFFWFFMVWAEKQQLLLKCCFCNKNNKFVAFFLKRWVWFIMVYEIFFSKMFKGCIFTFLEKLEHP